MLSCLAVACKEREPIHDENAPSCDSLQQRYAEVLGRAKRCDADPCSARVDDRLGCACPTLANREKTRELAELDALRRTWDGKLCNHSVACVPMPCTADDGGK